jgi:hypothetical protein
MVLESAPKTNEMLNMWLRNTIDIIGESVQLIIDAIESGDEGEVEYVAQELARDEDTGSELYEF